MKTPLSVKIRQFIFRVVRKITGHEYDCCNNISKRCSKCIYVKEEK